MLRSALHPILVGSGATDRPIAQVARLLFSNQNAVAARPGPRLGNPVASNLKDDVRRKPGAASPPPSELAERTGQAQLRRTHATRFICLYINGHYTATADEAGVVSVFPPDNKLLGIRAALTPDAESENRRMKISCDPPQIARSVIRMLSVPLKERPDAVNHAALPASTQRYRIAGQQRRHTLGAGRVSDPPAGRWVVEGNSKAYIPAVVSAAMPAAASVRASVWHHGGHLVVARQRCHPRPWRQRPVLRAAQQGSNVDQNACGAHRRCRPAANKARRFGRGVRPHRA